MFGAVCVERRERRRSACPTPWSTARSASGARLHGRGVGVVGQVRVGGVGAHLGGVESVSDGRRRGHGARDGQRRRCRRRRSSRRSRRVVAGPAAVQVKPAGPLITVGVKSAGSLVADDHAGGGARPGVGRRRSCRSGRPARPGTGVVVDGVLVEPQVGRRRDHDVGGRGVVGRRRVAAWSSSTVAVLVSVVSLAATVASIVIVADSPRARSPSEHRTAAVQVPCVGVAVTSA